MPLVAAGVCVGSDKVPLIYYVHPVHSWPAYVRRDALRAMWMHSHSGPHDPFSVCPRVRQSHRAEEPLTGRRMVVIEHFDLRIIFHNETLRFQELLIFDIFNFNHVNIAEKDISRENIVVRSLLAIYFSKLNYFS